MLKSRAVAVFAAIFVAITLVGCNAAKKPEVRRSETPKAGSPAPEAPKGGNVVAEIGEEKITLDDINEMIRAIPEQYQSVAQANKGMFLDSIINQKLLYGEASKLNLDKDPDVQRQLEEARKEIIIKAYLRKEIEDTVRVSDEDAKKYYEANKDKFKEPEKVNISHILVESEAEAKDILSRLKGGADFAALAKEKSKDASKDKGGELGLIAKGQTVPEFEQAAFALQPGQISGVIKTQFGYHVIKVTERQPEKMMAYDEIKDQLKQMMLSGKQKERFDLLLKDLKDKNKVVVYKDVLMPPPVPGQQGK